jgi:hypothetical protein
MRYSLAGTALVVLSGFLALAFGLAVAAPSSLQETLGWTTMMHYGGVQVQKSWRSSLGDLERVFTRSTSIFNRNLRRLQHVMVYSVSAGRQVAREYR